MSGNKIQTWHCPTMDKLNQPPCKVGIPMAPTFVVDDGIK